MQVACWIQPLLKVNCNLQILRMFWFQWKMVSCPQFLMRLLQSVSCGPCYQSVKGDGHCLSHNLLSMDNLSYENLYFASQNVTDMSLSGMLCQWKSSPFIACGAQFQEEQVACLFHFSFNVSLCYMYPNAVVIMDSVVSYAIALLCIKSTLWYVQHLLLP